MNKRSGVRSLLRFSCSRQRFNSTSIVHRSSILHHFFSHTPDLRSLIPDQLLDECRLSNSEADFGVVNLLSLTLMGSEHCLGSKTRSHLARFGPIKYPETPVFDSPGSAIKNNTAVQLPTTRSRTADHSTCLRPHQRLSSRRTKHTVRHIQHCPGNSKPLS